MNPEENPWFHEKDLTLQDQVNRNLSRVELKTKKGFPTGFPFMWVPYFDCWCFNISDHSNSVVRLRE